MKINYGINRVVTKNKRRVVEHRCGKMELDAKDLGNVIDAIQKEHPGWAVTGFYIVEGNYGA